MTTTNNSTTPAATRLTPAAAFELVKAADAKHGPDSWPRHAAEELWSTVRHINDARDSLVRDAERLAKNLAHEVAKVRQGYQPSSLGIVQSDGSEIDRRCILLGALNDRLMRAINACQSAGLLPEGSRPTV